MIRLTVEETNLLSIYNEGGKRALIENVNAALPYMDADTLHQRFSRNIIFTATTLDLKHILSINDTAIPDPQPLWGADFMFSVAHLLTASFVLV